MLYVVRQMVCDEFYKERALPGHGYDACGITEVEGKTANALSVLGTTTTLSGLQQKDASI